MPEEEPVRALDEINALVARLAEQDYPELWAALSDDEGKAAFSRSLLEAAAQPQEDREGALRRTIGAWLDAFALLDSPEDDEEFTEEERREVEEGEERLGRGEGIPLPRRR